MSSLRHSITVIIYSKGLFWNPLSLIAAVNSNFIYFTFYFTTVEEVPYVYTLCMVKFTSYIHSIKSSFNFCDYSVCINCRWTSVMVEPALTGM